MNTIKKIFELMPIINPGFIKVCDNSNNELIFLDTGINYANRLSVNDKTQCEAINNHFHLLSAFQCC
jgi:hypothetical protein